LLAQKLQREPLRKKRERKLVLLVTKGRRQLLKERFVPAMTLRDSPQARRFPLEPELRGAVEHAADSFFGQIFQRCLTATGSRQWNTRGEDFIEHARIDPHLNNVAIRFRAREKCARSGVHENVQHRILEGWVGSVAMRLPTAIAQIELDAAANGFAAVQTNRGFAKIGPRFTIPSSELRDLYIIAGRGVEAPSEIAGKPTRLQFKLGWEAARRQERSLPDTARLAELRVAFGG
jgi:hypothetical protein